MSLPIFMVVNGWINSCARPADNPPNVGINLSKSHAVTSSTWRMSAGRRIRSPMSAASMVITIRNPKIAVGLK